MSTEIAAVRQSEDDVLKTLTSDSELDVQNPILLRTIERVKLRSGNGPNLHTKTTTHRSTTYSKKAGGW